MKSQKNQFSFSKSLLALAVIAAYTPAFADDAEIALLTRPSSSVSVGVGNVSGDAAGRSIFGQYNGLRPNNTTLQLDLDINTRDDASGTALYLKGNNLGLDSRDLSVSYEKQGDWKIGADYSGLVHREVRTINTGLVGAGTATPTVVRLASPGTGTDYNLSAKREGMGLSMEKWFSKSLQMELSFKNENKTGARLFGTGYACAAYVCNNTQSATNQTWAFLMLPEPIDSTTKQIEAKLNYHDKKLTVTGGYYGSYYTNANGSIRATVPNQLNNPLGASVTLAPAAAATVIAGGGTSLQNVLQMPVSLGADNEAQQFYVSGSYRFTPTTNGTFKYSYARAKQDENFAAAGFTGAPAGVSSLGGVVDTRLAQLGLTTKVTPQLGLVANVKYERKEDLTPEVLYNVEGGAVTPAPAVPSVANPSQVNRYWYNYHVDSTKLVGKLEANYSFGAATRGTIGVDYNMVDRPVPISITEEELAGIGAVRSKNTETGYRLELRSSLAETFGGSIGFTNSKRVGNDWTSLSNSAAFVAAGLGYGMTGPAGQFLSLSAGNAFPMNMADVDRKKIKMAANWTPTDKVEVQLILENSTDKNSMPFNAVALGKGWRESSTRLASVDASYVVSDDWKVNAYASTGNQNLMVNHSTGYMADISSPTESFGLGVTGKATSRLEVGAQLTLLRDTTRYGLLASPGTAGTLPNITQVAPSAGNLAQALIGLPDVRYTSNTLNLFGKYALDKNADIRVSMVYQRATMDEWTWSNNGVAFVYGDNTTVKMSPEQTVTFIGASYIYKF
jgi:MtrB/PioB family decaheme-associated outer membrane protein